MKKLFLALAITSFTIANAAAVDVTPPASATQTQSTAAGLNALPTSAGEAPTKQAKANYDAMSRAEKIKYINERHIANAKKADAKWKSMSDDDKITKYEKRRSSFMARRNAKTHNAAENTPAGNLPATAPAAGTAVNTLPTATTTPANAPIATPSVIK